MSTPMPTRKTITILGGCLLLLLAVVIFANYLFSRLDWSILALSEEEAKGAEIAIQLLGVVISASALVCVVVAIFMQGKELKQQRIVLGLQRTELSLQRSEMRQAREESARQTEQFRDENRVLFSTAFLNAANSVIDSYGNADEFIGCKQLAISGIESALASMLDKGRKESLLTDSTAKVFAVWRQEAAITTLRSIANYVYYHAQEPFMNRKHFPTEKIKQFQSDAQKLQEHFGEPAEAYPTMLRKLLACDEEIECMRKDADIYGTISVIGRTSIVRAIANLAILVTMTDYSGEAAESAKKTIAKSLFGEIERCLNNREVTVLLDIPGEASAN